MFFKKKEKPKELKKEEIQQVEAEFDEQEDTPNRTLRLVCGCVFLFLSVFFLIVIYAFEILPSLNIFKEIIDYLFGKCVLFLPISLAIIATSIFSDDDYNLWDAKNFGLIFLIIGVTGIIHNFYIPVGKELYPDALLKGGGLIGGIITLSLHRIFGLTITFTLLLIFALLGVLLLLPYVDMAHYIFVGLITCKNFLWNKVKGNKNDEKVDDENQEIPEIDQPKYNVQRQSSLFKKDLQKENITKPQKTLLSARDIIAQKVRDGNNLPVEEDKTVDEVRKFYDRKEFKEFSDGIRKENVIKRIIRRGYGDDVYNNPETKITLKENPVNIPNWQEKRPIPNNGTARTIFGASMYTGQKKETSSKVVPLYEKNEEKYMEQQKNQEIEVTHYRTNEKDDIVTPNVANDFSREKENLTEKRPAYYKFPQINLLDKPRHISSTFYEDDIEEKCEILTQTFEDFHVSANIIAVTRGPSVTRFEIQPAPGVKVSNITNLADDIALRLASSGGVRIEAPIPGKAAIGIEVPNIQNDAVFLREIVEDKAVKSKPSPLCIGLGKDISGEVISADLSKMPHLLVAGSTGSGKSVCINTIIAGILFKAHPDEVKLILVDPKVVELSNYNGIPHLLTPVVTDMKKAASALHWAVKEMERRYALFAEKHVREINAYNLHTVPKLPFIVIIIDELSDLMMVARVDVEDAILRLAQKARAAGIHLILATQRPSVDVITGIIKANIPSRIAFAVSSQTDSRTILDFSGAEKLIGKGDMLYHPTGTNKPTRVQGAFVSDEEINRIVQYIVNQSLPTNYTDEVVNQVLSSNKEEDNLVQENVNGNDELFNDALRLVLDFGQASSSMLQRRFRIGYTRAARLVDTMEEMGIIGQAIGSKPREVIMSREEIEERFLNK